MKETKRKGWFELRMQKESFQRAYAREDVIENFLGAIEDEMEKQGVSRKQLAERLDCKPANITRIMKRTANLTAGTIVDLAWALGLKVSFAVRPRVRRRRDGELAQVVKIYFSQWESWVEPDDTDEQVLGGNSISCMPFVEQELTG